MNCTSVNIYHKNKAHTRVEYSPGRWEESSQEILKSHRKFWWTITHLTSYANVTRISFLSKEDIQVYQMNVLLIVDNFILTNKLPVTRKEYLSQEVDKIF